MRIEIARGALKQEIATVAPGARKLGIALTLAGAALYIAPRFDARWWSFGDVPTQPIALILLLVGWLLLGYVMGRRTEYVRTMRASATAPGANEPPQA